MNLKNIYFETCKLVSEKIYLYSDHSDNWKNFCSIRANKIKIRLSLTFLIQEIQQTLDFLGISHLNVYSPEENKQSWKGLHQENGLIVYPLSGRWFVIDKSPQLKTDPQIEFGDEILQVNKSSIKNQKPNKMGGLFTFKRRDKIFNLSLENIEIKVDSKPFLIPISNQTAVLKILSFRPEYFEKKDWIETSHQIQKFKKIYIDLRRNPGGNFTAMLRALSTFMCQQKTIGYLGSEQTKSNKIENSNFPSLPDDLDSKIQYQMISRNLGVRLSTFSDYGCFDGDVEILIDTQTGSVAEIMAHSLQKQKSFKVLGQPSSGQVLLAVWYDLPNSPPGYSISIPEANFYDTENNHLEAIGVYPDLIVEYSLLDFESGRDPHLYNKGL